MMAPVNERQFSYDSVSLPNSSTHIRLLELCPVPDKNDELYCKLYTASITDLPRYSAVSYAWGDNVKTYTIRVVDDDQAQTFAEKGLGFNPESFSSLPITSSLNTCLRQFRTYKELRLTPLWIDQICINQDDNAEKSCQIQLMGQIYSSARQVYAWLGLDADGSDEVIQAFCQVAGHMWDSGLFDNDHGTTNWFPAPRAIFFNHIDKPEVQDLLWKVIPILEPLLREKKILAWYKRTWFSRVWTIQEFCLNPYTFFVCGDRAVLDEVVLLVWEVFRILLDFKNDVRFRDAFKNNHPEILSLMDSLSANLIPPPIQHLFDTKVSWKRGKRTSLRDLLEVVSTRLDLGENRLDILSTKYRDRVYGLLGLAYDAKELNIQPDYRKTTTTAEVLAQAARAIIEKEASVYVLRFSQFPKCDVEDTDEDGNRHHPEQLPTWVPDWHNGTQYSYQFLDGVFSACGKFSDKVDLIPSSTLPSSWSTLGLRGLVVDTIEAVGMQWRAVWGLECYHRYILDYLSIIKDLRRRFAEKMTSPDGEDEIYSNSDDPMARRNQAIWRVPIGDCYTNGPRNRGRAKTEDVRPAFAELIDHCNFCCEKDEELRERRREWKEQRDQKQQQQEQQQEQDAQNDNITDDTDKDNETETEPQPELNPETQNFLADRWDELQSKGSYLDNMIHMDKMRPYLTEKRGYIGMAPAHAQPGDVVVLLCGDSIPYVLRPVSKLRASGAGVGGGGDGDEDGNEETREEEEDREKYYTFVGEAYCDGIMDGELEGRLETEREDFYLI